MTQQYLDTELIARIAHEANKAYCDSIGDYSQPYWVDAPDWQKQSAINGVENISKKGDVSPEESHENWLREKAKDGWTYGPVKDPGKKQHPCFVPYSELPEEQKLKDSIFTGIVRTLLTLE